MPHAPNSPLTPHQQKGKNIAEKDRPIRIRTRTGEMRDATPEERLQFFRANVSRRKHRAKKLFI